MPSEYYRDALKRAQKEFRSCTAKGEYPYLPVLDEFVSQEDLLRTVDLLTLGLGLAQLGVFLFSRRKREAV